MGKKTAKGNLESSFSDVRVTDYIVLTSIIISRDLIVGKDNTLSCIRLCDELAIIGEQTGPIWPQINICIEFYRQMDKAVTDFNAADLSLKVVLRNPAGKLSEITENKVNRLMNDDSWTISRLILPLTGYLGFKGTGNYYIEVLGKSGDGAYQPLLSRLLRVKRVDSPSEE